jgi:hypothetical protein
LGKLMKTYKNILSFAIKIAYVYLSW